MLCHFKWNRTEMCFRFISEVINPCQSAHGGYADYGGVSLASAV